MNLDRYKWYIRDSGHLYTSKVKQINRDSINEMARTLLTIIVYVIQNK